MKIGDNVVLSAYGNSLQCMENFRNARGIVIHALDGGLWTVYVEWYREGKRPFRLNVNRKMVKKAAKMTMLLAAGNVVQVHEVRG